MEVACLSIWVCRSLSVGDCVLIVLRCQFSSEGNQNLMLVIFRCRSSSGGGSLKPGGEIRPPLCLKYNRNFPCLLFFLSWL